MGFPVILTPQAIEDLGSIVRRIAADSPDRARAFGHALLDAALAIDPFPERGRRVPEAGDPAVREVLQGDYRIIYEVQRNPDAVYVLRFWHAARGIPHLPPS
ncbi:MAG TPA: type II toxin-antitoxin system RelE/ParE family toxin [Lacunisphaera sp.]|nr:type II toxin-antitoxin system RelE/ParE family toxin [Lacunisphaera sp.]